MRLACLLLLMMPAASLAAEDLPGLAALNLKAQRGVDASLAELISEATLSELRSTRRFKSVIGSSDVAAMISAEQQKQALGCDEDSCLAQLGGALGVPYLLTGSLGKVGSRYMLNIKLLAVEEAKAAGRITQMFASEDAIVDGLKPSLNRLLLDAFGAASAAAPSAAPAATPATTVASSKVAKGAWKKWTGLGLGVVGAGLAAYSFSPVSAAQTAYDQDPSPNTSDALYNAVGQANTVLATGVVGVVLGTGLWMWAP